MNTQDASLGQGAVPAFGLEAIEHALSLWRQAAARVARAGLPAEWQADYDRAATAVCLAMLGTCTSMQDLLSVYYCGIQLKGLEPALRGALADAALRGHMLNRAVVEDLAYWLRARRLIELTGETKREGGRG